jgi:hypothetical protein
MSTKTNAVIWGLLALLNLPFLLASGFWKQLRTYGWDSMPAIVVSSHLKTDKHGPNGRIGFRIEGIEPEMEFWDYLSEDFTFGREAKTKQFMERHAPGTRHQVYLSKDRREASFGRFPRDYESWSVFNSITWLVFAVLFGFRWRKENRDCVLAAELHHGSLADGNSSSSGRPLVLEFQSPTLRDQYQRQVRVLLSRERPYPSDEYATVVALLDCYPRMLMDVAHLQGCAECSEITALLSSERLRPGVREFFATFKSHELSQTARTIRDHLSKLIAEAL